MNIDELGLGEILTITSEKLLFKKTFYIEIISNFKKYNRNSKRNTSVTLLPHSPIVILSHLLDLLSFALSLSTYSFALVLPACNF